MTSTSYDRQNAANALAQKAAQAMLADIDRIARVIHEQEVRVIPELNSDATIYAETLASNRANIEQLLKLVVRGRNRVSIYDSPPAAFDIGRTFARRGLKPELLSLAYWHGHNAAIQEFIKFLQKLGEPNTPEYVRAIARYVEVATTYSDHVIRQVMRVEREEREMTSLGAHAVRNEIVQLILDGAPVDVARSSEQMHYDLDRYHTALVLWHDDPKASQGTFDNLVMTAAKSVDERNPLLIPSGASTIWAWVGSTHGEVLHSLKTALEKHSAVGRIAVGPTRFGIQGFRTSHTACLEMQRVLSSPSMTSGIAWYRDFAVSTLIGQDPQRIADFVQDTLRGLAEDTSRAARLRHTLRIYFAEASSAPRTAKRLHTHRNTIRQRIESATELLGYDPEEHRLAVELALQLKHQLGL